MCYNLIMFTGIIEEIGYVKEFLPEYSGARLVVSCHEILDDVKYGDSIAINGCCQTVVKFDNSSFTVQVSRETLNVTTFKDLRQGIPVNLERALTPTARMGGHIVQGHVDCVGKFIKKVDLNEFYELYFEIPANECKYVVHKGSIAINGVSLTVAELSGNIVKTAIIPHTFNNTTFSYLYTGDAVNIETDILGRYVEKLLSPNNNVSNITENFLQENGFL